MKDKTVYSEHEREYSYELETTHLSDDELKIRLLWREPFNARAMVQMVHFKRKSKKKREIKSRLVA